MWKLLPYCLLLHIAIVNGFVLIFELLKLKIKFFGLYFFNKKIDRNIYFNNPLFFSLAKYLATKASNPIPATLKEKNSLIAIESISL